MIPRCRNDFGHSGLVTNVARVDPQAGCARLGRLDPAFVMEMDVSHDWHRAFRDDFLECLG